MKLLSQSGMYKGKISIILCTYNRANLLKRAIGSIQKQKYTNWELVIVDDGSTDNTKAIVQKIKDRRIRYFYKKNTGVYDSSNFALKKITGEYFCFLDDDDTYFSEKLLKQITYLQKNKQIAICFSDYAVSKNKKRTFVSLKNTEKPFITQVLTESIFANSCFLFRTNKTKNFMFNTELKGPEATIADWLLRIGEKYNAEYCITKKPVAAIYRHDNNSTNNTDAMNGVPDLLWKYYKKNNKNFDSESKIKIESSLYFREGKYFFWKKQYKKSQKKFTQSLSRNFNMQSFAFAVFSFLKSEKIFDAFIVLYEKITGKVYIRDCS